MTDPSAVQEDPARALPRPDEEELRRWLDENGLPRFAGYSWRKHLPVLVYAMISVLVFELGMAPWLVRPDPDSVGLTASQLVLVPVLLAAGTLVVVAGLRKVSSGDGLLRFAWLILHLAALVGLTWTGMGLFDFLDVSFLWSDFTVDAAIIYVLLLAAYRLGRLDRVVPLRRRRTVVWLVLIGIATTTWTSAWMSALGSASTGSPDLVVPRGVPDLVLSVAILALTRQERVPTPEAAVARSVEWRTGSHRVLMATPVLISVFLAASTLLPYVGAGLWQRVLAPLVTALAALALAVVIPRPEPRRRPGVGPAAPGELTDVALFLWLAAYLTTYPVLVVALGVEMVVGSWALAGWSAAAFVLGANLLYLVGAATLAALAVERISAWAVRHAASNARGISRGLTAQLPLILVFAGFLLLTAETWEVAVETEPGHEWEFWALVLGLIGISLLLLFIDGQRSISRARRFAAAELRPVVEDEAPTGLTAMPAHTGRAADLVSNWSGCLRLDLSPLRWLNATAVVAVYQAWIFVPLLVLSGLAFWALAEVSVAPMVATSWVRGDDADVADAAQFMQLSGLQYPWLRVAMLLTAFSMLERVVRILTEDVQRTAVLAPAETALKARFAVALILDRGAVAGQGTDPTGER